MENNNQPLILGIVVVVAVLIIALALIFTLNSDDTATETPTENNTTENGTNGGGSQPPAPTPAPTPTPTPQPAPTPTPNPTPAPDPQPSVLPANWDSLTRQEKTDLNPFDCDYDSQWVSAEDGTCIDKPESIAQLRDFAVFAGTEKTHDLTCFIHGKVCNVDLPMRITTDFSIDTTPLPSPLEVRKIPSSVSPEFDERCAELPSGFLELTTEGGAIYSSLSDSDALRLCVYENISCDYPDCGITRSDTNQAWMISFSIPEGEIPSKGAKVSLSSDYIDLPDDIDINVVHAIIEE